MTIERMSLSDILFLYGARLRARAVLIQEGFAVLGIAIGVALLFASSVASTSLNHSMEQITSEVFSKQQFQFDARGPEGVNDQLLKRVEQIPGVRTALPVIEVQASVIGPHGQRSITLLGLSPAFASSSDPFLRRFSTVGLEHARAIALPAPLAKAIGVSDLEPAKLQVGANVVHTLVAGTLQEPEIGGLVNSPIAVAPIAYVQHVAGLSGDITRIFIGATAAQKTHVLGELSRFAVVEGMNLEPADFDSKLFRVASTPENQSESLFSAISAVVGFMFALNAMLITVPSRRKLIEDIRPQGATQLMTVQIMLFDALVLGVLACVLGLVLGELLSVAAFHATPGYLAQAFPVGNNRIVTWQSVALAVIAGLLAAGLGVLWPLRHVLAQLKQTDRDSGSVFRGWAAIRIIGGLSCVGATTIVLLIYPADAILGIITLVIALVCLLPLFFDAIVAAFEYVQRLGNGAATILAVTELQTPRTRVRSLAITATAAVAVFGIVAIEGTQHGSRGMGDYGAKLRCW